MTNKMLVAKTNENGKWHLLSNGQSNCISVRNKEWAEIKEVDSLPKTCALVVGMFY